MKTSKSTSENLITEVVYRSVLKRKMKRVRKSKVKKFIVKPGRNYITDSNRLVHLISIDSERNTMLIKDYADNCNMNVKFDRKRFKSVAA